MNRRGASASAPRAASRRAGGRMDGCMGGRVGGRVGGLSRGNGLASAIKVRAGASICLRTSRELVG
jgi:hypothetical protein